MQLGTFILKLLHLQVEKFIEKTYITSYLSYRSLFVFSPNHFKHCFSLLGKMKLTKFSIKNLSISHLI